MSFVTRVTISIQLIQLIPVEIRVRINPPQCHLFVINKAVLRIKLKKPLCYNKCGPKYILPCSKTVSTHLAIKIKVVFIFLGQRNFYRATPAAIRGLSPRTALFLLYYDKHGILTWIPMDCNYMQSPFPGFSVRRCSSTFTRWLLGTFFRIKCIIYIFSFIFFWLTKTITLLQTCFLNPAVLLQNYQNGHSFINLFTIQTFRATQK